MMKGVLVAVVVAAVVVVVLGAARGVRAKGEEETPMLFPAVYDLVGPFSYTSRQQGADPLQAFRRPGEAYRRDDKDTQTYPSELVSQWAGRQGGRAYWQVGLPTDEEDGTFSFSFPGVRYNQLADWAGSAAYNVQGWAFGELPVVDETQTVLLTCLNVREVFLDKVPFAANPYGSTSNFVQSVRVLEKGRTHVLAVHIQTSIDNTGGSFQCYAQRADAADVAPDFPLLALAQPDMSADWMTDQNALASPWIAASVLNAGDQFLLLQSATAINSSTGAALPWLPLEVPTQTDDGDTIDPQVVRPGQARRLILATTRSTTPPSGGNDGGEAAFPFKDGACPGSVEGGNVFFSARLRFCRVQSASASECDSEALRTDPEAMTKVVMISYKASCRSFTDKNGWEATFLDFDQTVQYTMVMSPTQPCPGPSGCAILLATHGAGVEAKSTAWTGAYQRQPSSFVILPTNRDEYGTDWQGPGFFDAITAITRVATHQYGVPANMRAMYTINAERIMYSGHSMGGHGALVQTTLRSDVALSSAPTAGWIDMQIYADYHLRTSDGLADAALRSILYASVQDFDTDLHASNAVGFNIQTRSGGNDSNVPPWHLKRWARLVDSATGDPDAVTTQEIPDENHWFGGVVDDADMQRFYNDTVSPVLHPLPQVMAGIVAANPATHGGRANMRVLQQHIPFRVSRIALQRAHKDSSPEDVWTVKTVNVRRLELYDLPGRPLPASLTIDNTVLVTADLGKGTYQAPSWQYGSTRAVLCNRPRIGWEDCTHEGDSWLRVEKGPTNYGPVRLALSHFPIVIVYGTVAGGAHASHAAEHMFEQLSITLANRMYYQSRYSIAVLTDSEFERMHAEKRLRNYNIIAIGAAHLSTLGAEDAPRTTVVGPTVPAGEKRPRTAATLERKEHRRRGLVCAPEEDEARFSLRAKWQRGEGSFSLSTLSGATTSAAGDTPFAREFVGVVTSRAAGQTVDATVRAPLRQICGDGPNDADTALVFGSAVSLIALQPLAGPNGNVALVVDGTSLEAVERAVGLVPYVSGITLSDFLIADADKFRWAGSGGVLAAGFFGNDWKVHPATSYFAVI